MKAYSGPMSGSDDEFDGDSEYEWHIMEAWQENWRLNKDITISDFEMVMEA